MLIGREAEVQRIVDLCAASSRASGQLHLIQLDGDLGSGKSAVLAEALSVLHARAAGDDEQVSYRVLLSQPGVSERDEPLAAHQGVIEQILGAPLVKLLAQSTPTELALRVAGALGGTPTLLAVDDAHLLDQASISFLTALLRVPITAPLTVLLAHRTHLEPETMITSARRRGATHTHITLGALPEGAVSQIVQGLSVHQAAAVVSAAEGNPLFAHTLVAAFRRHPSASDPSEALRRALDAGCPVLKAAIAGELDTLASVTRDTLESIAVLVNGHGAATTDATEGPSDEGHEAAVSELASLGLVRPREAEPLHAVVQYSVQANMTSIRLRALHRIAATGTRDPLEQAEHLAALGSDISSRETQELVRCTVQLVGVEPARVARWLEGVDVGRRTLRSEAVLARAMILRGRAHDAIERIAPSVDCTQHRSGSSELAILLADAYRIVGSHGEARALLAAHAKSLDPRLLREYIDILVYIDGHVPERLLSRLESIPGAMNRIVASTYRTMSLLYLGKVPQARATFARVQSWMAQARRHELGQVLHAIACAAWSAFILDEYTVGARLAERGLSVAREQGRVAVFANLGAVLSGCQSALGLLDEAEQSGQQAVSDGQRFGPLDVVGIAQVGLLTVAQGRGQVDLLKHRFQELEDMVVPEFVWWRRAVLSTRMRISAYFDKPQLFHELLGEPRDAMSALRRADYATALAALGRPDDATAHITEALMIAEGQELPGRRAMVQTTHAEMLLRAGEPLHAGTLLRGAIEIFDRLDMKLQLARAQRALAQAEDLLEKRAGMLVRLSTRERDIAALVADGLKNREIAEHLMLSHRTVENHLRRMMRRLSMSSRQEIADLVNHGSPSPEASTPQ